MQPTLTVSLFFLVLHQGRTQSFNNERRGHSLDNYSFNMQQDMLNAALNYTGPKSEEAGTVSAPA